MITPTEETLGLKDRLLLRALLAGLHLLRRGRSIDGLHHSLDTLFRLMPRGLGLHYTLGVIYEREGRTDEAAQAYTRAVEETPDMANAHNALGKILIARSRPREAVPHLRRAIALDGGLAEAHSHLGRALAGLGRLPEARLHFERAIACKSGYVEAHNYLGQLFERLNRPSQAIESYRHALELDPAMADTHFNLGCALQMTAQFDDAIRHFEKAAALRPGFATVHNNLGASLQSLGRSLEACVQFEKALANDPGFAEAHHNLGWALQRLGRTDEALVHLERAVVLNPRFSELHHSLGVVLMQLGRFGEAYRAIERAIEIEPGRTAFYLSLSDCRRFDASNRHFKCLQKLGKSLERLPLDQQVERHFAMGKICDDVKEHRRSFGHWAEGNALKRRQVNYDEAATLGLFRRIEATFTREVMNGNPGQGDPSPVPTFIVGMPRSGTSLVEQVLAAHPKVFGAGEMGSIEQSLPVGFPECMNTLAAAELGRMGADCVQRLKAVAPASAECITDKLPANFLYAGLIRLMLPNARIIHVVRNPVDTCLSGYSRLFTSPQPYAYNLAELGRYFQAYDSLMAHWRSVLPDGMMLEVRYEDLVTNMESAVRRILGHCGLEWDPACLAFHATNRPVRTSSVYQVRQPVYRTSVGRWRHYGRLLDPLFEALGPRLAGDSGAPFGGKAAGVAPGIRIA